MRVLEARFHPWTKARGPFVVVGRVLCRRRRSIVDPTPAGREENSSLTNSTMLQKLEYIVGSIGADAFRRLMALQSDFWSFVEIDGDRRRHLSH